MSVCVDICITIYIYIYNVDSEMKKRDGGKERRSERRSKGSKSLQITTNYEYMMEGGKE